MCAFECDFGPAEKPSSVAMGVKRHCTCCAVLVAVVAILIAGIQVYLKDPKNAEAAVRQIVKLGNIPETVYDHIEVVDPSAWFDIVTKGNLGIAEGYMHGRVKVDALPFFVSILNGTSVGTRRAETTDLLRIVTSIASLPTDLLGLLTNQQTRSHSKRVTEQHYDAGNDLYERMLGPSMSYTCAYWKDLDGTDASNLDEAQRNKFDLIRRKLELEPGMTVADLGMGWGTAAAHMHKEANVKVTGVSLSKEQVKWAKANLEKPGLNFIWSDFRDHCEDPKFIGHYDRVYSIGMMEHVGYKNFDSFFKCIKNLLKPDGLAVVHTIGEPDFVAAGDSVLMRLKEHAKPDGGHLYEQIGKSSGKQYNAKDLSWSYAEVLSALGEREKAMAWVAYVGRRRLQGGATTPDAGAKFEDSVATHVI